MLKVVSLSDAVNTVSAISKKILKTEYVALEDALLRTAGTDIVAEEYVPSFDRSTVDGFAVNSRDTFGCTESMPSMLKVAGTVKMGEPADVVLKPGECVKTATGGMLPEGADAVVMVEYTSVTTDGYCLCYSPVSPLENVTKTGDDTSPGDVLVKKGGLIDVRRTGVLAAAGVDKVPVLKRPLVSVISTGDELTAVSAPQAPGKVRNVNSHLLEALCRKLGCDVKSYGIIPDDTELITGAVSGAAAQSDVVFISGGSSAGEKDETCNIISSLGSVLAHGIAVKPGKPTVLGKVGGTPVIGLPGHPAAAYFIADTLLRAMLPVMGVYVPPVKTATYPSSCNISSNHGREEFVCVGTGSGEAVPHFAKSGIISMLSKSDGYIVIPRNSEGVKKGEPVEVRFFD